MRRACAVIAVALSVCLVAFGGRAEVGEEVARERLVPLKIELPQFRPIGTKKDIKLDEHIEKPSNKPRPPFMAPEGTKNVARHKPVTSSDEEPYIGDLEQVTDGDKQAHATSYMELGTGRQWVQIDLGAKRRIFAIVLWHFHGEERIYHDVVVQVADDPDFITNVRTLYNSDYDNSSGLGIGKDLEYIESHKGRLVDAKGGVARYVRLYSNGSTANGNNHYTEVDVYGKPAP
jgi:hypothetical protein